MKRILTTGAAVVALMTATPAYADAATDWWELANKFWLASMASPG
jgi:hypothetical protein